MTYKNNEEYLFIVKAISKTKIPDKKRAIDIYSKIRIECNLLKKVAEEYEISIERVRQTVKLVEAATKRLKREENK